MTFITFRQKFPIRQPIHRADRLTRAWWLVLVRCELRGPSTVVRAARARFPHSGKGKYETVRFLPNSELDHAFSRIRPCVFRK